MARPRDPKKPRWESRKFSIGFVEDFRDRGVCYARIGDWRKSLAPLLFVRENRRRAVTILDNLIAAGAHKVPPSRVKIAPDGSVTIRPDYVSEAAADAAPSSLFAHFRGYRQRRESEGLASEWNRQFRYAIRTFIGDRDLPLDAQAIRAVVNRRLVDVASDLSPTTARNRLSLLHAAFTEAVRIGALEFNPVDGIQIRRPSKGDRTVHVFTQDEEREIFQAVEQRNPRRADFYRFLRLTAMRQGEARTLTLSDIVESNDGRRVIRIGRGKGDRPRFFPVDPDPAKLPNGKARAWSREVVRLVDRIASTALQSGRLFDFGEYTDPAAYLLLIRRRDMEHDVPDGRSCHSFRRAALSDWRYVYHFPPAVITLWSGNNERTRGEHYYRSFDLADALDSLDSLSG